MVLTQNCLNSFFEKSITLISCLPCVQLNQKNLSLSSRCQLFDQFQDRMSQHAVKLDFLSRVHRQNAPNRRSSLHHNKKTIKVDILSCPICFSLRCKHEMSVKGGLWKFFVLQSLFGLRSQMPLSPNTRILRPCYFLLVCDSWSWFVAGFLTICLHGTSQQRLNKRR